MFKTSKRLRFAGRLFTFQINWFTVLATRENDNPMCGKVRKIILFARWGGRKGVMSFFGSFTMWNSPRGIPSRSTHECYLLWTKGLKYTEMPYIFDIYLYIYYFKIFTFSNIDFRVFTTLLQNMWIVCF